MEVIIIIIALFLVAKPIVTGICRLIYVLFSGIFNLFGVLLFSALAILGICTLFMTGPIGWVIGLGVFIMFKAVKS